MHAHLHLHLHMCKVCTCTHRQIAYWRAGTSGSKSGSWMQAFPNTSPTASGNPKQSHPVPEQASQGLADITNQAARSCASKTHAQSQIPHVDSSSRQQISAGRGSNTPQHMPQQPPQQGPQQYPQAGSTGDHHNILLASGHSHEPAAILRRPSPARDAVRQADEAASHAASTLQASLPSQDHAESQQQQQQQQRLQHSNLNLPRIVGLSSTLCLLDLPDSNRLQGTDGKLAWAAERVTSIYPFPPKFPHSLHTCRVNSCKKCFLQ